MESRREQIASMSQAERDDLISLARKVRLAARRDGPHRDLGPGCPRHLRDKKRALAARGARLSPAAPS